MGMGFVPTGLRQVPPLLHKTTLTTGGTRGNAVPIVETIILAVDRRSIAYPHENW